MIINLTARALRCVEITIDIGVVRSDAVACGVSLIDAGAMLTLGTSDVRFGSLATEPTSARADQCPLCPQIATEIFAAAKCR